MSDDPPDRPKTGRDASGRFAAGNPGGGRPALPDWFRDRGPDSLRVLLRVMDGELIDEKVSRAQAAQFVKESIYGKAPQSVEGDEATVTAAAAALVLLATKKKEGEG